MLISVSKNKRKKITISVLALLFLSMFATLNFMTIPSVEASSSIVGTSTQPDPTWLPHQRKSFYANGRFWVFWSDDTNMVYATSIDGVTWTSKTIIRSCTLSKYFSIWFDGTYVHYAYFTYDQDVPLYYRRGTPNNDGTITWSDEQTVLSGIHGGQLSIAVDSNGYPWIGYRLYSGTTYYPYVTKSFTNDGTWSTASGFPKQLSLTSSSDWSVGVVPLTSGKMYVIYTYSNNYVHGRLWTGSSWESEETISTHVVYAGPYFSVVANGDDVHYVYMWYGGAPAKYKGVYRKRTYGSGWGSETELFSSSILVVPVLSIDLSTGNLYSFWQSYPSLHHIYYKKCVSGTWDASPVDWIDETSEQFPAPYSKVTSFYKNYGGYIGVTYTTKTTSPYNVKFAYLSLGDTTPPTYSNLGVSTTIAGASCQFHCQWSDNVGLSGYIFGTNNTGTWHNETWTSLSGNPAWSNVTKTLNSTVGVHIAYRFWANDTNNNWADTGLTFLTTSSESVPLKSTIHG